MAHLIQVGAGSGGMPVLDMLCRDARIMRVTLIEPGFVVSEFQGVAGYDAEWLKGVLERLGPFLTPADVARSITFTAAQPSYVHVCGISLRPTRQEYP